MKNKEYKYKDHILSVGKIITDCNGFSWMILRCGPHKVWAHLMGYPEIKDTYVSHWHFIENTILRGTLTRNMEDKFKNNPL